MTGVQTCALPILPDDFTVLAGDVELEHVAAFRALDELEGNLWRGRTEGAEACDQAARTRATMSALVSHSETVRRVLQTGLAVGTSSHQHTANHMPSMPVFSLHCCCLSMKPSSGTRVLEALTHPLLSLPYCIYMPAGPYYPIVSMTTSHLIYANTPAAVSGS